MRLISPQWSAPSITHAFITTRSGGLSRAPYESLNLGDHVGDDFAKVIGNRKIVRSHVPSEPFWLTQTHSTKVSTPLSRQDLQGGDPITADASVTNVPNEVLAILTADCLPIFFSSKDGCVIGAAHAGWRGLCAGVIENTASEMLNLSPGLSPKDLVAWLGPAIGPESFEVGADVVKAFQDAGLSDPSKAFKTIENKSGKYLADIYQLARDRLNILGITDISGGGHCTVKEGQDFFSYRRDGKTGRFASFIWISK